MMTKLLKGLYKLPTYKFLNTETQEEFTDFMSISGMEKYLEENPHIKQLVHGAPMICDPVRVGVKSKPDNGFRDLLKQIQKNNGGIMKTDMNTF